MTHFVVNETPFPFGSAVPVGRMFNPRSEEESEKLVRAVEDEAETKVVKPRRGRRPAKATEEAETK
jgi:hypothetical protein